MMMKNMKKISLAVIAISTAMLSTSCLREENFGKADSKFISLKVSTEGVAETKAGHVAEPLEVVDLSQDGLDLFLYGSVKVNKMSPFEPMTKAAKPYYEGDESLVDAFDIQVASSIETVDGVADRENENAAYWNIYKDGKKVEWTDESSNNSYFLAYWPQTAEAGFKSSTELNYSGDGSEDFLVAYSAWPHDHANHNNPSSYVPLTFRHPLALVRFKIADSLKDKVTKIVINNVATSGVIDAETLVPTSLGTKSSIEVTADEEIDGVYSLYVMPDDVGEGGINVTFYVDNKILTTQNLGTQKWVAGMIYNYTLSNTDSNNEVDIKLSDAPEDAESIVVENQLNTALWLRAAVIANRVDRVDGNVRIVEAWDKTVEIGTDWTVNTTDGYYYYQKPVIGYQAAEALIKSIPSYDGTLGLQIGVAVQAIEYDGTSAEEAFAALN